MTAALAGAAVPQKPVVPPSGIKPIELVVEASGSTVILPSGSVGTLVVTPCVACVPRSFVAGGAARYFIGRTLVSIEDVRRELTVRPQARVGVFFDAKTHELTRVFVSGTVTPAKSATTTLTPSTAAPAVRPR
jgi:hypothetical protein